MLFKEGEVRGFYYFTVNTVCPFSAQTSNDGIFPLIHRSRNDLDLFHCRNITQRQRQSGGGEYKCEGTEICVAGNHGDKTKGNEPSEMQ